MGRRLAIFALLLAGPLVVVIAIAWPEREMMSRDIGCAKVAPERGKEICNALSDSMEWTWTGHAIVSPGWRVTWNSLRRVYCRAGISIQDLAVLESMRSNSDGRLHDGVDELIRLTGSSSGRADEPENSIFNPRNALYILKGGCK